MTIYRFLLDDHQAHQFQIAIRCRYDVMLTWMHAIKIIISYYPPSPSATASYVEIHNSKMNRLFFCHSSKVYSIAFPFKVVSDNGCYVVKTISGIDVDSRLSSDMIIILKVLKEKGFHSEWDFIEHFEDDLSDSIWPFLTELLDAEDGYLRFDHDPRREDGHRHPLDHADLFYTNAASFKIGLPRRLDLSEIIDMLDRETDCHFLRSTVLGR